MTAFYRSFQLSNNCYLEEKATMENINSPIEILVITSFTFSAKNKKSKQFLIFYTHNKVHISI